MHADWATEPGAFGFKYWFLDQDAANVVEELSEIYEIQLGEYERTNFVPYIIILAALLVLIVLIFGLWICFNNQRKINDEAMKERK